MKILEHNTIQSSGGDGHHFITLEWLDRQWKIAINDNCVQKITTVHLWDNNKWRSFAGHDHNETLVFDAIKNEKLIKIKYRIQ